MSWPLWLRVFAILLVFLALPAAIVHGWLR
jgi:hypothetical protein